MRTLNWAQKCNYRDGCFKVCKPRKYKYGISFLALKSPIVDRAQNIWVSSCIDQFGLRVPNRVVCWNSFTAIELWLCPTSEHNGYKAVHLQDHAAESSVKFWMSTSVCVVQGSESSRSLTQWVTKLSLVHSVSRSPKCSFKLRVNLWLYMRKLPWSLVLNKRWLICVFDFHPMQKYSPHPVRHLGAG